MPLATVTSSEALSEALIELVPDPIWVVDGEGAVSSYNAAFERWWKAMSGASAHRGMTLDASSPLHDAQQRALAGRSVMIDFHALIGGIERAYAIQAQPLRRDDTVIAAGFLAREIDERSQSTEVTVELSLTNLFDADDEPLDVILVKALEFLGLLEASDGAVLWTIDEDGRHLNAEAMWFADAETRDKVGPRISALHFEYGHGVPGRVWASRDVVWIPDVLDESTMQRAELLAIGGLHSVVGAPLTDSTRVTGVIEFFTRAVRPISERRKRALLRTAIALGRLILRRRAEDERRRLLALVERKSAEWMLTFDAIELPIFLVNEDDTIARVNRAARDFAASGFDDLVGRNLRELGQGEPWTTLADTALTVRDSGIGCAAQIMSGDATWDVSANPLWADESNENNENRVVIVLRDLTQILSLQDAVRRGEQLAALGELVAGVAHEVKNPIFGMGMTIELLRERFEDSSDAAELLAALRKWLDRLNNLTESLLEYGKTWNINLAPGRSCEAVRQALEICQPLAVEAGVSVDFDDDDDAVILMDASRLTHVFENLVSNAIQFSPAGARVTISTERSADRIEYSVRDRGPGFAENDLPRIFQPFFTRRRGGTGLGLSIVQRVIDEHGGTVDAGNHDDGGGAVVSVSFPLYAGPM